VQVRIEMKSFNREPSAQSWFGGIGKKAKKSGQNTREQETKFERSKFGRESGEGKRTEG